MKSSRFPSSIDEAARKSGPTASQPFGGSTHSRPPVLTFQFFRSAPFTVCVYCGSRHGARPSYTAAARAVGTLIGARGWQLVYGGGKVGLMGEVADAVLAAGGRVVGVIPDSNLLLVKGSVPGAINGVVEIHKLKTQ